MRARTLVVRGFRNLADATARQAGRRSGTRRAERGHGKTNVLEALAYPVLFRSVRGAADREISRFGGPGFHVTVAAHDGTTVSTTYAAPTRRKRITLNDEEQSTIAGALGRWLAVLRFSRPISRWCRVPRASGGDGFSRMLSLADRAYLDALLSYRGALAQRNAALRAGNVAAAEAFDATLARAGAAVMSRRLSWAASAGAPWEAELATLGEPSPMSIRYKGDDALADAAAWGSRLAAARHRDLARGQTHVGPHRDDVVLGLGGHGLRDYGSTGQQRSAAIALRLLELEMLAEARGVRPALLVDDVFAELDRERQARLAARLVARPGQRIVTAPREEELPGSLELPRWQVVDGVVRPAGGEGA